MLGLLICTSAIAIIAFTEAIRNFITQRRAVHRLRRLTGEHSC